MEHLDQLPIKIIIKLLEKQELRKFSLKNQEYDEDNIADHLKDHSLFIGYAPYDNPQVSIAVIIENGGHGSAVAAPIAKKMIDFYFETIK